jgi:hypothetical protein
MKNLYKGELIVKKGLNVILFTLLLSFLTGCAQEEQPSDEVPQFLDVKLSVNPEQGQINEPVLFEAKVTYGDEAVTDADEVTFEVWRSNDENHEKIKIEHGENGIYSLEKSFSQEGTYYIYAHVTAKRMHNMPKKEFVIGQASEPEVDDSETSEMNMEEHEMMHNNHEE